MNSNPSSDESVERPPGNGHGQDDNGDHRVLLINDDPGIDQWVREALRGDDRVLTRVDGYLMALGQIPTAQAPNVVVGRASLLRGTCPDTVEALRRLAPGARLVLLSNAAEAAPAGGGQADGFDAHVTELGPVEKLRVQIDRVGCHDDYGTCPQVELGDVDLIEQMLSETGGDGSIRRLAIRVVQQQSGWRDLGLVARQEEAPCGHAVVPVSYGRWRSGHLHAGPPVTEQQLGSWAAWLGRWLAMEKKKNELWQLAMRDELTGVWNRRYFNDVLDRILQRAAQERFNVTLMVFDIDDFKSYNDRYGHGAGDEILREAARLMVSVVREHDIVARIGGDEFGVIFWESERPRHPDSHHPHDVVQAAKRFQRAICEHRFPKLEDGPATLSVSGGLAGFPWDGRTPQELLELADQMALRSKQQGKNAFTFGPGARKVCQLAFDADAPA